MSGAYYNEIDPYVAAWLRNLIAAGHIAAGDVDERSIEDVRPDDLRGYTQCHFFAGIGTWSYALRLAGWPDDRPVWTGSCPCQPFSAAGQGLGFADERHLWPLWHWLIGECRPVGIFGEQVASKSVEPWIDLVFTDLEAMGYACGTTPFPSAGVGAPHIRDRAFFVAHAADQRQQRRRSGKACTAGAAPRVESERLRDVGSLGHADGQGLALGSRSADGQRVVRFQGATLGEAEPLRGFWQRADWIYCRDGKYRPVEPGTFPLAHGATARVGRLRAYGNAINPWAAKAFIEAADEAMIAPTQQGERP